ncbi:xylulokinase [Clostridium sediminicola]|uniref:FGGY-family carbohydrate kinase n=1 Tax=Clostridium sediminicola TaxID=3114879 RepID=UPI0031F1D3F3
MKGILTIDIGTSSIRGIVYDLYGNSQFIWQQEYSPEFKENNWVEQNPNSWSNYLYEILKTSGKYSKENNIDLLTISLTAQRSSVIPVDINGKPLYNAIMWQDRRTVDICRELETYNALVYKKSGLKISPVFSAVKMSWFKKHCNDIYKSTYKMMGIQDYLLYLLTGNFVTDESLASRTNLFNLSIRNWDDDLINLFDIEKDKLCDLVHPGGICGTLQKNIASVVGLKEGIPIISAGGDQQCAALGLGVMTKGDTEVNTGTGGYIISHSEKPVFDPDMRIFCNASSIPGKYIVEAAILTSGNIYNWFNENFYDGVPGDKERFNKMNMDVINTPVGSRGVILTPHFKGSGAPNWNPLAKGMFYNVSLETNKGDMARAILEGIVTDLGENIKLIEELTNKITKVTAAGGLSSFDIYNQMQADTFNSIVNCYPSGEATALGAWISASVTLKIFSSHKEAFDTAISNKKIRCYNPISENTLKYKKLIEKKKKLFSALNDNGIFEHM